MRQGGCNTLRQNVSRETLRQAGAFGRLQRHLRAMRRLRGAYEAPTRRPQDGYEAATCWLDSPPSIDDKAHLTYLKCAKLAFCLPSGCILRYFCAENADYGHSAAILRPFCGHSVLGCGGFSGLTRLCSHAASILSVPCFSLRFFYHNGASQRPFLRFVPC